MEYFQDITVFNWKEEFKEQFHAVQELYASIQALHCSHFHNSDTEVSDEILASFFPAEVPLVSVHFILLELKAVLLDSRPNENLTVKYYGIKFCRFLRHKILEPLWIEYIEQPNPPLLTGLVDKLTVSVGGQVLEKMCWVIADFGRQQEDVGGNGLQPLRSALELLLILQPLETEHRLMLSRVYLQLHVNMEKASGEMSLEATNLVWAGSPHRAEHEPGRLGFESQAVAEISADNQSQDEKSRIANASGDYANLPFDRQHVNFAAACIADVTPSTSGALAAATNWAEQMEAAESAEDGFTVVKHKRRRRESPSRPVEQRSSGVAASRWTGPTPRRRPPAGGATGVQMIRAIQADIADARARQRSSTEDNCVFVEHCPDFGSTHYLQAVEELVGGAGNVLQVMKMDGHMLVGLSTKALAERLIRDGLDIGHTHLRAFPFKKRAERITVGNLPFFVDDAAVIEALKPYGDVTSIVPIRLRAGRYTFTDGRREAFILLKEGIALEKIPTRVIIRNKGNVLSAFISYGVKCSRCGRQGHRRANCPIIPGRASNNAQPQPAPLPSGASSTESRQPNRPTPTAPAPSPKRPAPQTSAPGTPTALPARTSSDAVAPPSEPMEFAAEVLAPPTSNSAPQAMEPTEAPKAPADPRPPASQPPGEVLQALPASVAPPGPLHAQGTLVPPSPSSSGRKTRPDLEAFLKRNPGVSFAGTGALGLGREEVLDLLSSKTKARKRGQHLTPPQSNALAGLINQILDLRPGVNSNIYKVLRQSYLQNCRYNSQAAPPDGDRPKLAAPPLLTLGRRVSHSMMQQKTLSLGIAASTTYKILEVVLVKKLKNSSWFSVQGSSSWILYLNPKRGSDPARQPIHIRKFWELEDVPISKAQLGIKNAPSPSLKESIQNSPSLKEFTQNFPSLPGSIQTSPSLPDSVQGSPSLTLSLQSSKHNSPTPLQVSVHSLKEAMSPLVEMPSSPGCSKQIPIPIEEDSIESQNRVDNLPSYPMSPEQSYTLSSASVEDFKAQSGPKSPTSPTRGSESCRCSGDYTEPQMSQNSNFSCSSIEESEDNSSNSEENLSRSEDNPSKSEEIPSKSKKSRISKLTPQITSKQNQLLPSESSQPSTPEQPLASQSSEPLSSKKETSIIPKIKPPPYYRRKRQLPTEKTSWDEPIESDIKSNWTKFQTQLSCLKEIKIPRYLNSSSSEIEELQLHGFCDASLNAYSAVFYLKTRFKIQKIKINLITSKTKVAPLKTITIPRLELSAALLLAQLNQVILESFPFQPDKTFLWTDSQICIDWIRSDASRWKAFVSNRVSSIQNLTQITDWFHVSSQDNPADCASRGIMPQDLVNHRIWWRGPIWLQENNVRYIPSSPTQVNLNIIQEEVGEGQVLDQTTLIQNSETMLNLEFIVRYSTMTKLIRITAWCWRFYYNCLLFDPIRQKGPLTTRELTKAIQVLVKSIQQVEFCTEIKLLKSNKQLPLSKKLTSLNPFLDTQGLLRVGGRLKYSYLNENQNFPLLQPKSPRQESLIKNLLTENADIPEAIDENQEDSSILETTFVIEDEESNKDIGTPKIEISEVSVIDKSEGKYSKEPVVSVEALEKKELCHDDPAHLNVVEADLNRPKEATSGIINISTEANESASKEKVVPVEIVDTSTKDYLQSGEKAKSSRWKPIDSLCLEDVKESEDDDENYSSSAYIEWPEILKKEVLRPEPLEKAVNLEDFEKAAESRQLSKEHLEESTEQGSCIKAESKPWEDPIESDLAAAESDNPAVPERELANESENLIQNSPQSDTQRWKLIPLPFKQ
ncbi:hypothetical protein LAZ67_2004566 [Cordylochernes scorpioides]|uniref:CCHC-type domain-containing protein n=1 Tax=Cordylochernes scorpioides TaxID=51811 RepID=A0ABY6K3U7_9ARAC|nr:hypothetical protein LAZ67_2004566 [Cordylochernes scorpioides]